MVCPELELVHKGFAREDLFTCVHEQFMTETAAFADIVLPATMFLEHDDFYTASGHTFFQVTKAVIEPPGECRENHYVISELAKRLGAEHRGFDMTPWEIMDETLASPDMWDAETNWQKGGQDFHLGFETSHFLDGFAWPDKKFRFKPDWAAYGPARQGDARAAGPFRRHRQCHRRTSPSGWSPRRRAPSSTRPSPRRRAAQKREVRPTALMNPEDCARAWASSRASGWRSATIAARPIVNAKPRQGQQKGVVVVEGIWPNRNFETGIGINALTSADPGWPNGGAVFHDTAVWIRKAS